MTMKWRPLGSSRPKSKTCTMFGCTSRAAASASRRKRETNCWSSARCSASSLTATWRSSRRSNASWTVDMPPKPEALAQLVAAGDELARVIRRLLRRRRRAPPRRRAASRAAASASSRAAASVVGRRAAWSRSASSRRRRSRWRRRRRLGLASSVGRRRSRSSSVRLGRLLVSRALLRRDLARGARRPRSQAAAQLRGRSTPGSVVDLLRRFCELGRDARRTGPSATASSRSSRSS